MTKPPFKSPKQLLCGFCCYLDMPFHAPSFPQSHPTLLHTTEIFLGGAPLSKSFPHLPELILTSLTHLPNIHLVQFPHTSTLLPVSKGNLTTDFTKSSVFKLLMIPQAQSPNQFCYLHLLIATSVLLLQKPDSDTYFPSVGL